MNIKQMEEKSGLSRANIRYYEQEGLLAPARLDNGYRDYSDADLATLQKVRLLRELGLSIETIHRLQAGEESLPDVLAARMDELQAGAAAAEAAHMVCAALRADGTDYADLDAEKYLSEAARLTAAAQRKAAKHPAAPSPVVEHTVEEKRPVSPIHPVSADEVRGYAPLPLPDGWKQVAPMPWRRYFARLLDIELYRLLVHLVLFGWLRIFPPKNSVAEWGVTLLAMLLMVLVEPLLLMWFGTTPGKWLLGIRLVWRGGRRFFYSDGLVRTARVLMQGMGLNLPILNLFCLWQAWRNEKHGTYHAWEDPAEWYLVRENDRPNLRLPICIAACAAVAVCANLVALNGYMPAYYTAGRGVTAEQFAANFNAYNDYFELSLEDLNPDGSWADPDYMTYRTIQTEDGELTYLVEGPDAMAIKTDADGYVTKVSHCWQSLPYEYSVAAPSLRMHLALLSMAAAQPDASVWQVVVQDQLYRRQVGTGLEDREFEVNGIRVRYTIQQHGYRGTGGSEELWQELYGGPDDFAALQRIFHYSLWDVSADAYVRIEFSLEKLPG